MLGQGYLFKARLSGNIIWQSHRSHMKWPSRGHFLFMLVVISRSFCFSLNALGFCNNISPGPWPWFVCMIGPLSLTPIPTSTQCPLFRMTRSMLLWLGYFCRHALKDLVRTWYPFWRICRKTAQSAAFGPDILWTYVGPATKWTIQTLRTSHV